MSQQVIIYRESGFSEFSKQQLVSIQEYDGILSEKLQNRYIFWRISKTGLLLPGYNFFIPLIVLIGFEISIRL
jgi:hypothetical protein